MPVILFGGRDPGLPPSSVSGLTLWLKADAGVYSDAGVTPATDGNTVQQWNDQSGGGFNFTQATAGNRPTFKTSISAAGGQNVVRFGGATDNDFMTNASANSNFFANNAKTVMIVCSPTVAQLNAYWGSSDNRIRLRMTAAGNHDCINDDGAADTASKGTLSTGTFYSLCFLHSGGNIYSGVNDARTASMASVASGNTAGMTGTPFLGSDNAAANACDGDIAEIACFNVAVSEPDRQQIERYFAFKYNIVLAY